MPPTTLRVCRALRCSLAVVAVVWSRDARAQVTVSGSPAQMTISTAVAGGVPNSVSNSTTTYTVTKPASGSWTITAQLNTTMPVGVTLTMSISAVKGAASAGPVTLTTAPVKVVTGITKRQASQGITYTLSATLAAGVVPVQTRRVTLTAIAAP